MQVLYVHQNFPAQFGHLARRLSREKQWQSFHVSQSPPGPADGVEKIQYKLAGGATNTTHFCSRTFENTVWHCDAIYRALKERPDVKPDLIVGHSGFGSTLFLRELYPQAPVLNLFEYYYRPHDPNGDMDFRHDLNWKLEPLKYLRSRCRNAMILLDLQNCQMGYCPTQFQTGRFPREYQHKLRTVFDGIDREIYHGHEEKLRPPPAQRQSRLIAGVQIPPDVRIVTYVSRSMESMRGFDLFMKAAKLIYEKLPNVLFVVAGDDKASSGGDDAFITGHSSFKNWVLAQDAYDLGKFLFTGFLPQDQLATLLASTDLHVYLTVPFVLSWSMIDAMSCGAVVLGSATTPVKEFITDGVNGLLADFFNPQEFADAAIKVLKDPAAFRPLGRAAEEMVANQYSLDAVFPQMLKLYEEATRQPSSRPHRAAHAPRESVAKPPAALVSDTPIVSKIKPPTRSPFLG
jgi:glycosyltransferase involved in cell wall biosynthesis